MMTSVGRYYVVLQQQSDVLYPSIDTETKCVKNNIIMNANIFEMFNSIGILLLSIYLYASQCTNTKA